MWLINSHEYFYDDLSDLTGIYQIGALPLKILVVMLDVVTIDRSFTKLSEIYLHIICTAIYMDERRLAQIVNCKLYKINVIKINFNTFV